VAFGGAALPELHELMGHGRREVRNAAADALGEIGDERSIPYLVAGLQGNSRKASTFRPSADIASEALSRYPVETRVEVLRQLKEQISPQQTLDIIKGFDTIVAIDAVEDLHKRNLLLLDWMESPLDLIAEIDEETAWAQIYAEAESSSSWFLSHRLPKLTAEHQLILVRDWVARANYTDHYEWEYLVRAVLGMPVSPENLIPILQELDIRMGMHPVKGSMKENRSRVSKRLRALRGD
jgi:hypothetical protein